MENRRNRIEFIEKSLKDKYEVLEVNGMNCFKHSNGTIFHVDELGGNYDALVIEYADNLEEAKKNQFEDGDLFYMDELDKEEMLNQIIAEIES